MEEIYITWRVDIRRVWRVVWITHCKLQPHLANCMDIEVCSQEGVSDLLK